jgi:hypothetical protein
LNIEQCIHPEGGEAWTGAAVLLKPEACFEAPVITAGHGRNVLSEQMLIVRKAPVLRKNLGKLRDRILFVLAFCHDLDGAAFRCKEQQQQFEKRITVNPAIAAAEGNSALEPLALIQDAENDFLVKAFIFIDIHH